MPEGRPPISSSRIATGDIARHTFAVVRRGFDPDEVRSYLQSVSRSIEALEQREQELQAAVVEADERAAHPVIDEATLTASLGQHSAQILRHAHEEAARIVAQAQDSAATLLRDSQAHADDLQARAEASSAERVVEVELMVANAEQESRNESERILADAVAEAEAIIARAKEEGKALLEQVQEARRRVLADLAARRRTLGIQIEQLRAARDEMTASVHGVRERVDSILAHLERTDDRARAAAHGVGDQLRPHAEEPHDQDAVEGAVGEGLEGAPPVGDVQEAVHGSAEDTGSTPAVMPSVDELFARIRAGTKTGGGGADTPASEPAKRGKASSPAAPATAAAAAIAADAATDAAPRNGPAEPVTAETVVIDVVDDDVSPAAEEEEVEPDPLVRRRDELITPVVSRLSRNIKRALGDDQNRLLDQLRNAPAMTSDELLGPEEEHVAVFARAARKQLGEAFAAGTVFAGAGAASVDAGDVVDQTAVGMARSIVAMLRRQVTESSVGAADLGDRVGAAFREWRGERVERLSGDSATLAFSAGVTAALAGSPVRWVVTSTDGCSDCEDNALAGALEAGETFPTGHGHPPAHSGCRCLLAPGEA